MGDNMQKSFKNSKTINIMKLFNENAEVTERTFVVNEKTLNLYFIDCLINKELFAGGIVPAIEKLKEINNEDFLTKLEFQFVRVATVKRITTKKEIQDEIFNGAVVIDVNKKEFLAINLAGYSKRSITEPPTASVVRGPREGFIEDVETNLMANIGLSDKEYYFSDIHKVIVTDKNGEETELVYSNAKITASDNPSIYGYDWRLFNIGTINLKKGRK